MMSEPRLVRMGGELHESRYRPDIDGLRAIAVVAVVLCHAFPRLLPGGFVGVDIFFVISGYLITSILLREAGRGSFSLRHFYDRRIRRLFPALIATLLFVLVFGWFCLFTPEFVALGRHLTAASLFSENLLLWHEAGYFDRASEMKPTLHLWSLAIEEQFYILWPLLLYGLHRLRWHFGLVCLVLAALSFAVNLHDIDRESAAAYYSPLGRAWELMAGAWLADGRARDPGLLTRHAGLQSVAGAVLIAVALLAVSPKSSFPGFWALLPTLGTLLLLSSGEHAWVNHRLLSTPPMIGCGLISYPLYLWHWPLLSFGHIVRGGLVAVTEGWACVIVSAVAATLTFLFIERPLRLRGGQPAVATPYLLGGMGFLLACGLLMATRSLPPRLHAFDAPARTEWDFVRRGMKSLDNDTVGIYRLGAERPRQALFIGDSHVAQYAERLDRVIAARTDRLGAVLAIGGGCIPVPGVSSDNPERAGCEQQTRDAYRMAAGAEFRTVVIGGNWNWYFLEPGYAMSGTGPSVPLSTPAGRQAVLDDLAGRARALAAAGKRVIVLLDNPESGALGATGRAVRLSLKVKNFRPHESVAVDPRQAQLRDDLRAWALGLGLEVIDPFAAVCSGNVCRVTSASGQPLYKDFGHFNPDWAIAYADFIDATVDPRRPGGP